MIRINLSLRRVSSIGQLWLPALAALLCLTACHSNRLTRERAAEAIRASAEFQKPASIDLLPEYRQSVILIGTGSHTTPTEEFALRRFLESHPELAVLRHLGMIEVGLKNIEHPESAASPATFTTSLTTEGRAASSKWQQSGGGWSIPLAKRELVEVTGVVGGEGDSKQAKVEYTWRWRPTEVGANFDTSGQAYQSLPAPIRESFGTGSFADALRGAGQAVLFDGGRTQKATATLQLYDDGWRVERAGT